VMSGLQVVITSSNLSPVTIVSGVVLTGCIVSKLCISIFRFLVISAD
jgi:hypothetical protein